MIVDDRPVASEEVPERWRLGPAFVPKGRYTDREFLALELDRLFPRTWLNACRLEEIEKVGQYVDFVIGDQSIVVLRTAPDRIKAFFNSCRHRGTRLVRGEGRIAEFRCPFHGWRWEIDGRCKFVFDQEHFAPRSDEDLALQECLVDTWGGWVFVNMDRDAMPLLEFLDPLPDRMGPLQLEDFRFSWFRSTILPCNWKTALDAFIEGYHTPGTHPQLIRTAKKNLNPATMAEIGMTQSMQPTETFARHARFSTGARPSAKVAGDMDPALLYASVSNMYEELRALNTERDCRAAAATMLADRSDGRSTYAIFEAARRRLAELDGVLWNQLTPKQAADGFGDWHIFPNTIVLVLSQGGQLGYRARPHPTDPDTCYFDVWSAEIYPPDRVPKVEKEFYADWRDADWGDILTQDFTNMGEVTMGLHSRGFDGHRLNLVEEMSVWNHHKAADEYLFG